MTIRHIIHAVLFTLTGAALAEPVSSAFTYQGRLNHNGSPANGTYDLRFDLYSAETGGAPIGAPIVLPSQIITGGLFSADLNFGGPAVFNGTAYWLAVSAKPTGAASYVPVPGRAAIRPTPYSIHSLSAAAVKDGAITSSSLANGAVTGAKLASSAVGLTQLNAAGTPGSGQVLAYNGTGLSWITPPGGGGGSGPWLLNGVNAYYNNGNVGIGTTSPANRMTVQTSGSSYGVEHTNGTVRMSTYVGGSSPAGGWLGTISAHPLSFFVGNGSSSMTIATNGNVGIGTPAPVAKLDVFGDQMTWGKTNYGNGLRQMLNLFGEDFGIGIQTANVYFRSGAGFAWHVGGGHHDDTYNPGGGTTLMTLDGLRGLDLGSRIGRQISLWGGDGPRQFNMGIQASTFYQRVGNGVGDAFIWYKGGSHNDNQRHAGGGQTLMMLDGETGLTVSGKTTTSVLTITGGADLAEPFPMKERGIQKGSVVVIDEDHPGRLKQSTCAYDRKVAGIVSGANGIQPGISMIQEDELEAGENVSLCGRVYVRADTGAGIIRPGDLLTTSDKPGHAMKAADHEKAQGAILGKAMTGLTDDTGFVLVLVTLQ